MEIFKDFMRDFSCWFCSVQTCQIRIGSRYCLNRTQAVLLKLLILAAMQDMSIKNPRKHKKSRVEGMYQQYSDKEKAKIGKRATDLRITATVHQYASPCIATRGEIMDIGK